MLTEAELVARDTRDGPVGQRHRTVQVLRWSRAVQCRDCPAQCGAGNRVTVSGVGHWNFGYALVVGVRAYSPVDDLRHAGNVVRRHARPRVGTADVNLSGVQRNLDLVGGRIHGYECVLAVEVGHARHTREHHFLKYLQPTHGVQRNLHHIRGYGRGGADGTTVRRCHLERAQVPATADIAGKNYGRAWRGLFTQEGFEGVDIRPNFHRCGTARDNQPRRDGGRRHAQHVPCSGIRPRACNCKRAGGHPRFAVAGPVHAAQRVLRRG
ncbi:hypothetical protein D9M73_70970 [compost metagenome]